MTRFATYISEHAENASREKEAGILQPPFPKIEERGLSWECLINAKRSEHMAAGTMKEIERAINLSWETKTGVRYQIQRSENGAEWENFGPTIAGDGDTVSRCITRVSEATLYRLRLVD